MLCLTYIFLVVSIINELVKTDGTQSNFTIQKQTNTASDNILPNKRYCGLQHSDEYYHTVNGTVLSEFPWLALIIYRYPEVGIIYENYNCGGSFIHNRYVLTAASCIIYNILFITPEIVRLGEYNTDTNVDCIEDAQLYECSGSAQDFGVEDVIWHPEYFKGTGVHNVGLIRLNASVLYTDYIRPICLPQPGLKTAKIGDTLTTSGWGYGGGVKKRFFTSLATVEECQSKTYYRIMDNEGCSLITANGSEFTCDSGNGGPVMFFHRFQWIQEGIISLSERNCTADEPHVYLKVASYIDWIKENIKL